MLQAYVDNPGFRGSVIGAGDINILVDNAHILDEESRRGRLAFTSRTRWMSDYAYINPCRIWWGSFQYLSGLTTATIIAYASVAIGQQVVVLFDGVEVARQAMVVGDLTISVDISNRGYVNNQIVEVDVLVQNGATGHHYEVRDAYVSPVESTVGFAWPGVPDFSDRATRAQLQHLSNAGDWVATALFNAREPMPMAVKFLANLDQTGQSLPVLAGTLSRAVNNDRFAVTGYIQTPSANQETLRLYINDALVASETRTRGSYGPFTFDVNVSGLDASARHTWRLEAYTDAQGPEPRGRQYYSVHWALTYRSTPWDNPYPLPPRRSAKQASTVAQWLDDLNRIRLHYANAHDRIANAADTFNRIRMFSRRFDSPNTNNEYNNEYFSLRYVPQSWRRGEGIWIRGKNVKLCYGTVTSTPPGKDNKLWSYTAAFEESVTEQDKLETKYIAFDLLRGLNPGDWYYLTGDVRGAFQVWRT